MRGFRLAFAMVLAAILSACAVDNTRSDVGLSRDAIGLAPPNAAMLVVYRPAEYMLGARSPTIEVNSAPTCDARSGGAFARVVDAGTIILAASLWSQPGTSRLTWTAEAGKTYYVRVKSADKNWAGVFGGLVGMMVAEVASERAGPFDLDLTDEAAALASGVKLERCEK